MTSGFQRRESQKCLQSPHDSTAAVVPLVVKCICVSVQYRDVAKHSDKTVIICTNGPVTDDTVLWHVLTSALMSVIVLSVFQSYSKRVLYLISSVC